MEETVSRDPPYSYYTSGESAPAAKHFAQLSGTDIYYECNTVAEVWDGDVVTDLYYPALTRFYFTVSQSSGLLASTAQKCDVNQYTKYVDNYLDEIETSSRNDEMYLPFLATHDNDRTAGYLPSMNYLGQMTANLLLLGPGSQFIYYGECAARAELPSRTPTTAWLWSGATEARSRIRPANVQRRQSGRRSRFGTDQVRNQSLYLLHKTHYDPQSLSGVRERRLHRLAAEWHKGRRFHLGLEWPSCRAMHNTSGSDAVLQLNEIGLTDFHELRVSAGSGQASLSGSTLTIPAQTSVILK